MLRLTLSIYNSVIQGHVNRLNHVQSVFAHPRPLTHTHSLSHFPPSPALLCLTACSHNSPSRSLSLSLHLLCTLACFDPFPPFSPPLPLSLYLLCSPPFAYLHLLNRKKGAVLSYHPSFSYCFCPSVAYVCIFHSVSVISHDYRLFLTSPHFSNWYTPQFSYLFIFL